MTSLILTYYGLRIAGLIHHGLLCAFLSYNRECANLTSIDSIYYAALQWQSNNNF